MVYSTAPDKVMAATALSKEATENPESSQEIVCRQRSLTRTEVA